MAKRPSMEMFDAYFQRADLDRDGRISGAEAVSFFQGSNLSKPVLAQIWMHADQNRVGFLGRKEFHNALRLVTVAQSGRELTPDIVEAALFGPAAAKIPPPQINTVAGSASQTKSLAAPGPQMVAPRPSLPQNFGFRGGQQVPPNAGMNQQFFSSPENQYLTPQAMPNASSFPVRGPSTGLAGASSLQAPRFPNSNAPRASSDWLGARPGGFSMEPPSQAPNKATPSTIPDAFGLVPSGPSLPIPTRPVIAPGLSPKSQDPAKDSKALVASGNGFSSDSIFGGDIFSATQSQHKQTVSTPPFSAGNVPNSSVLVPAASRLQPAATQSQPDPFASMVSLPSSTSQLPQAPSGVKPSQLGTVHSSSGPSSSSVPVGAIASESSKSQLPWPKMTVSDVAKYTKVFVEVDTDRDGKITGEQARNLFLSWRLPREVLKQVWDLSDQDSDSMLSLREFCTALYLMERYRDGRPLPEVLPDSVKFDSVLPPAGQLVAAYGGAAWGPTPGVPQQGMSARRPPVAPSSGPKIPPQVPAPPQADDAVQPIQQKSRVPVLEKHLTNQLSKEEQSGLNSKFQEATNAEKKVEELEKEIFDSQQKIEFYRTKMQELILYKSRCDNRLNEVMERVIADKHEVEILGKKYEEKCRQLGDVASKLTIEEATFRDIQEKKMKLYTTIAKMGQGGAADGSLQVRADQVQSDLEGLVKALNERCKKYGIRVKRTILVELPLGWQPSIQDGTADWDEDWDKFEDEGFTTMKEVDVDEPNITAPPQIKSNLLQNDKASADELFTSPSPTNGNLEKPLATGEQVHESGSVYAQSEEDLGRSPAESPVGRGMDSPSREFPAAHFGKDVAADASPRDKETDSDHAAGESTLSRDRYTDEHSWGPTFDANDDTDSVWGFGSKEPDLDGNRDNSFFGSEDLGLNPIRTTTDSPRDDNMFQKKSPFFADSVPGTPLFNSSSPPRFSQGSEEHSSFDNFSRFDSFNHDSGFFAPQETLARFDSIRSTRDSGGFTSFDDSDPFNSTGPFKSSETQTSRRGSDNWSAF